MARGYNRTGSAARSLDRGLVDLHGVATMIAGPAITDDSLGFAITRTGVGLFTVTLDNFYNQLLGFRAEILEATPTDKMTRLVTQVMSTRILTFQVWDISAAAAAELATGDKLFVWARLRKTAVPRKGI